MDSPLVPTPLIQLRRRAQRPSWFQLGTITTWLAVGGFVAYAVAYSYAWSFLDRLGATPEEVGFTQPGLVIRLVVYGSTFVAVLGLAALLIASLPFFASRLLSSWGGPALWTAFRTYLQDHLRSRRHRVVRAWLVRRRRASRVRTSVSGARADGTRGVSRTRADRVEMQALRRRTAVVTAFCALTSWSAFWATGRIGSAALWGEPPLLPLALIGLGFYAIAQLRHVLALVTATVLLIALTCASASRAGNDDARVFERDQTQVAVAAGLIGLRLSSVKVSGSPGLPSDLVLLGHTDGVYVLASTNALYRVRDSEVLLTQRHP